MTRQCTASVNDERSGRRANVFLAGMLHSAGGAFPVRIRNLSTGGALVEGKDLPDEGNAVRLQRGPSTVAARIAWHRNDTCGLRFSAAIPAEQWIAYGTASSSQQRVDAMVERVRSGTAPCELTAPPDQPAALDCLRAAIEIEAICEQFREATESLACDAQLVAAGFDALQRLDAARQQLAGLAARMRGAI